MLPGIGMGEYVIIAVAALVVIGPKNLPVVMRKVGQFVHRLRMMAAEFRASFDEMARQSELDELRKQVEELRQGRLMEPIESDIRPTMEAIRTDLEGGAQPWTPTDPVPDEEPDRPMAEPKPRKRKAAANGAKTAPSKTSAKPKAPAAKAAPAKAAPAKRRSPRKGAAS